MSSPATPASPAQPRPIDGFHAVVPAGGAGTRLWPLSRQGSPKFLHDLTGTGRTLLQGTVDRLLPLTGRDGVLVVTGVRHAEAVAAQLPELGPGQVVAEGVAAARAGYVVTVGIEATEPSTAFGYIRAADALGAEGAPSARHVAGFTEKPDAETAAEYLATGDYWWNAGMFLVQAGVLLDHLARQLPPLAAGLRAIAAAWADPERRDAVLAETWPGLTKIAIDHAIAEP